MKSKLLKLFKRDNSDAVISIGKEIIYQGKPAIIKKRIKSDLDLKEHKYNCFQQYVAQLSDGQMVFVQESDIACPIKKIK